MFQLINAQGEYIKDSTLEALGDAISNPADLEKSQKMFSECYDNGN